MKKIILALSVLFVLASCQEQQKIAFIDNQEISEGFNKKTEFEEKYKLKVEKITKKADSIQKMIQFEYQLLQKKRMSQAKGQEAVNGLLEKKQMLEYQLQIEQQSLQEEGQKMLDSIDNQIKDYVSKYGKDNGYTYILGKTGSGSVMYGEEKNDITDAVLKGLNGGEASKEEKTETTEEEKK